MPGLFDDIIGSSPKVLNDQTGRFDKLNPDFQNQIIGLATDFYATYNKPLVLTDTFRTQGEQAEAYRLKPTLALPANHPNARHPRGLAIDIDQNQSEMITPQMLANNNLHLPALYKGETWHVEPYLQQASNPQPIRKSASGLFDDILSQPQLQQAPTLPVTPQDALSSAVGSNTLAMGQGGAMGQGMPQEPNTLIPTPKYFTGDFMTPPFGGMEAAKNALGSNLVLGQLPTLGMVVGGATGGLASGGLGAVPGAALGGAGGKALELFLRGQKGEELPSIPSQAMQMGIAGLGGATAEMGGQVAGKALEGLFAPGKKWLSDQLASVASNRAAQELANQGLPISPTTIAPSAPAKAVTWIAERFQPGKSIVDSYRKQTMDMIMDMRRNLIEDMGLPAPGSLGSSQQSIKDAFTQFKNAAGPKAEIPLPNTKSFLEGINTSTGEVKKFYDLNRNEITADEFYKMFPNLPKPEPQGGTTVTGKTADLIKTWKDQLQSGTATVEQIERINADLWPKGRAYGKMTASEKGWRDEFLQNMYKDLGAQEESLGVNLATLLQSAKGTARQNYQAQYLEGLLDRATNNETMQFNPQQFADLVKKNQQQIFTRFDPEQRQYIFNFADKMKAVAPERALFREGREKTDILSWLPGGALGAATYANPSLAVPIGFQAIVARSLMAPKGIVRKWLTTGFGPPTLPIKIGIMEGQKND